MATRKKPKEDLLSLLDQYVDTRIKLAKAKEQGLSGLEERQANEARERLEAYVKENGWKLKE
jgi:hypothetical protein